MDTKQPCPPLLLQILEAHGPLAGIPGLLRHPPEKELGPLTPGALLAYRQKQIVVVLPVLFEKCTEIKQRQGQEVSVHQQKSDRQPADATIAIQEGMNGLKLVVNESQTDKRGISVLDVQIFFEGIQGFLHFRHWRRHKLRVLDSRAGPPDPVLGAAEFAGSGMFTKHSLQQPGVEFPQQLQAHR